jgi:hypothetical protein
MSPPAAMFESATVAPTGIKGKVIVPAGTSADDDNIALGVVVQILEVASGHGARDLALAATVAPTGIKGKVIVPESVTTTLTGQGQSKLLEQFGNKWDEFKFAPIRESQVSRAMTRRYFQD